MSAQSTSLALRPLGNTGIEVSAVCFGTSALGDMPDTYGYSVDAERARNTIRAIFDGPGNFIDTSRNYGAGRSEHLIGEVIKERGGLPGGMVLSTKLDRDPNTNTFDAVRARRSLEESLQALGVERVSLLHLHDPEHTVDPLAVGKTGGALSELFKMKDEGIADAVGLAAGDVEVMMPLLRDWDFDALITHNRYTLVNRNAEAMIDFAHRSGIAVLNAAPYSGGIFAKSSARHGRYVYQPASEAKLAPVREIEAICERFSVPAGAAALQFSIRDPRITSTICGISTPERVEQTFDWATLAIAEDFWRAISRLPYNVDNPEADRELPPTI